MDIKSDNVVIWSRPSQKRSVWENNPERKRGRETERERDWQFRSVVKKKRLSLLPNQQRTLNELPTELRCRNFVNKHRLGIQNVQKCVRIVYMVCIPTKLPFCIPPLVVGYYSFYCGGKKKRACADFASLHHVCVHPCVCVAKILTQSTLVTPMCRSADRNVVPTYLIRTSSMSRKKVWVSHKKNK